MGETDRAPLMLDAQHLSEMTGGDAALAAEVIGLFLEQGAACAPSLSADRPRRVWADAAHALKGSALGVGAFALARACTRAERLGRGEAEPETGEADAALDAVHAALAAVSPAAGRLAQELARCGASAFAAWSASKDSNS